MAPRKVADTSEGFNARCWPSTKSASATVEERKYQLKEEEKRDAEAQAREVTRRQTNKPRQGYKANNQMQLSQRGPRCEFPLPGRAEVGSLGRGDVLVLALIYPFA